MAKTGGFLGLATALLVLLLMSGCVRMEASQKIKRSGASDFNFSIESDYLELMNITPETVAKMGFAVENGDIIEGDGKLTVSWENAYFPPVPVENGTDGEGNSSVGTLFGGAAVTRNFSFPNFVYTIRFKSKGFGNMSGGDLGDSSSAEQLLSAIKLNYRLETFGKIVDTNGAKLSDNSALFDLKKEKEYYVVFSDFFLSSVFGGFSTYETKCPVTWTCSEWSDVCVDGKVVRECRKFGECDKFVFAPITETSCREESETYSDSSYPMTTTTYSRPGASASPAQKSEGEYEAAFLKSAKALSLEKKDAFFGIKVVRIGFFKHLEFGDWGDEVEEFRVDYEATNLGNETKSFFFDSGSVLSGGVQYKYSYSTEFSADDVYPGATVKGYALYEGVPKGISGSLKIVAGDYYAQDYKRTYVEFDAQYP